MKTASKCIEDNDIETAIKRHAESNKRWEQHWWDTIVTIFENSKNWAKVYVLDKVNHIIKECVKQIKKAYNEEKPSWCYWIRIFKDNKLIFNKIGTTQREDPNTRLKEIINKGWKSEGITVGLSYEVKRIYNLGNMPPEGLESEFRAKLIRKYKGENYVKNDRFRITNFNDEPTIEEMDAWALDYGATIFE